MVAGTHGKTTTTSLLAFLLDRGRARPVVPGRRRARRFRAELPAGRRARTSWSRATSTTARSSTSGPKFVHYLPDVAVIGNVEYDHADIYPDLAGGPDRVPCGSWTSIPRRGLLVAGRREPGPARDPAAAPSAASRPSGRAEGPTGARWTCAPDGRRHPLPAASPRGRDEGEFALALAGEHNVRNALAALAVAAEAGVSPGCGRAPLSPRSAA